jgi:hypothetical protein
LATIFKRKGGTRWVIQYFDSQGRRREKAARTTDYRAAERIANKLEADVALRRGGLSTADKIDSSSRATAPCEACGGVPEHCRGRLKHTVSAEHTSDGSCATGGPACRTTLDSVERQLPRFERMAWQHAR